MKTTKKLACIFAAFAMVMMTYSPARAEYLGTWSRGTITSFSVEMVTQHRVSMTVYWLRSGGIVDIELLTFDGRNGAPPLREMTIPRRAERVVIEVDSEVDSTTTSNTLRLSHAGNRFEIGANPHATAVVDLVD